MADLGKIVYMSEEQKTTLFANGSVTVDGVTITYSANDLYVTPNTNIASASVSTIWTGTQIEYDAITTKDSDTLYFIVEAV